jgi:hypothetical protein
MPRVLAALLAACALSACTDATSPLVRDASFTFVNGPDSPGPSVLRSTEGDFFMLFNDDRTSRLVSLIRLPSPPGDVIPCGGAQGLNAADLQLVFHRNGAINELLTGADVSVRVYDRASFGAALGAGGLCHAIATQEPIAEGAADFTAHDNDTFFSGVHANAFGWSARGTVYAASDGAELQYRNDYHGVVADDGSLRHLTSRITLTPARLP